MPPASRKTFPPPARPPKRALLVQGNEVLHDRKHLELAAQGGSLAAHSLREQMRRWISREMGEESNGSVAVFGDLIHLSASLHLDPDVLSEFARGFGSTPFPSSFHNILQSCTHSAMHAHLSWLLPSIDILFLAGFNSDTHARWLRKLLLSKPNVQVVRIETEQGVSPSMEKLVRTTTAFEGLMNVQAVEVQGKKQGSQAEVVKEVKSRPPSIATVKSEAVSIQAPIPVSLPPRSTSLFTTTSVASLSPAPALPPPSEKPAVDTSKPPSALPGAFPQPPSPTASTAPSTTSASLPASSSSPSEPTSTTALPRAPTIPPPFLPILQTISSLELSLAHSHQSSQSSASPPAPLWSAVASKLQKEHEGGGTFAEHVKAAQRAGWVTTGRGEWEGSEWVRVSQRGVRALKRGK
ncbi:hypothetical protein JCM8547_008621 [Rhodosporidiobolus lusitaniae]